MISPVSELDTIFDKGLACSERSGQVMTVPEPKYTCTGQQFDWQTIKRQSARYRPP